MNTFYYSHPDGLAHDTGLDHPECADRLTYIEEILTDSEFSMLVRPIPPLGTEGQIRLVHSQAHIDRIVKPLIRELEYLDEDTVLSQGSPQAAFRAVGAVCAAVDSVLSKNADNAFCAMRPPGHHASPEQAMGFCLFNNIAIAANYARNHYQLERIAIVDFDVHHGNGTQAVFHDQANVLYASTHQMPQYPGTGFPTETGVGNLINVPMAMGDSGVQFRRKYAQIILPALKRFKPDLLLISAGFDAHRDDPLSGTHLLEQDFAWLTRELMAVADQCCQGRIVSALEGGYHLQALAASVAAHIYTLMTGRLDSTDAVELLIPSE